MDQMIESTGRTKTGRSGRSISWIILYGTALLLLDFGPGWVLTYHEAFFAEPAREFLQTGDWVVPRVASVPCWQKLPQTSWLIVASMAIFQTEAEWAVRLSILVATILNAWLAALLAVRWHGDRIGRLAGFIQLTAFYVLFQARLAESDMLLCLGVTAALTMFGFSQVDVGQGRTALRNRWLVWGTLQPRDFPPSSRGRSGLRSSAWAEVCSH